MATLTFAARIPRLIALTLALGALAHAQVPAATPAALAGVDAYAAMDLANAWKGQPVTSYVTPQAVHFAFQDGQEVEVALPDDVMLVSVAPYLVRTHPCLTHYASGCQGELVDAPFHVRAALGDGTVVIDEVRPTMANGFVDLWLPRGHAIELTFELDGYRTVGVVTTHGDSPTCITTLQLAPSGG
ncbi:MAG: CueP family metal-binding protein [Trueperaceae bacterium]|nr:CueP family metal-binding protein [Trueperaceae bacterium]